MHHDYPIADRSPAQIECAVQSYPIDVLALRRDLPALPDCGGYVAFEGIVRDINAGKRVVRLDYEAYETLATKEMRRISEQAAELFQLRFVRAVHRTGSLSIGESAVMIQTLSRHRREAFEGCRFIIDQLKARVPIWKKEHYDDGTAHWTRCHDHDANPRILEDA